MARVKLSSNVRDKLTGFEGIAMARSEVFGTQTQVRVDRLKPDGSGISSEWIVEKHLEVLPGEQLNLTALDPAPEGRDLDSQDSTAPANG